MTLRGLKSRLSRLEAKAKPGVPTIGEYLAASSRERTRNLLNAKSRLYTIAGKDTSDLETVEGDTPELREKDVDVVRRYRQARGVEDETAAHAESCRARLRSMVRMGGE